MLGQIAALKNDDLVEFRMIYTQYHSKLYHYIYNRTQSAYLSQEVVQLTFIKLWEKRKNLSDDYPLNIQLFRIAKTILIDELRKETVKQKYSDWAVINITEPYEDNQLANKEDLKMVFAEMENLPPVRKKVFKLSRIQGLSYKQIADVMSISPKTVENHISRAIKQLRNAIHVLLVLSVLGGATLTHGYGIFKTTIIIKNKKEFTCWGLCVC